MYINVFQFLFIIVLFSFMGLMIGAYVCSYRQPKDAEYRDDNFASSNYYDLSKDGIKTVYDNNYDIGYARGFENGYEKGFSIRYLREKRQNE